MGKKALVLAWVLWTPVAAAQARVDRVPATSPQPQLPLKPAPTDEVNDAPERAHSTPELIPTSPEPPTRLVSGAPDLDTLGRHILPYAFLGYTFAYGKLDSATNLRDTLGSGAALGIGVGYGLSRNLEFGAGALLARLSAGSACSECSATAIDPHVYIAYHLVQGTRFDPWVRFGVGASVLRLSSAGHEYSYYGVNWGTLTFGGDWFATKNLGLGPVLSLALQSYQHVPSGRSSTLSERCLVGLRVTFDLAGH